MLASGQNILDSFMQTSRPWLEHPSGRPFQGLARRAVVVGLAVLAPVVAAAASIAMPARGTYLAGPYPDGPFTFVNEAVGATIFYNSGFLGSSTVIGNIEAGLIWDGHEVFDRSGLGLGPAVEQAVAGTGVDSQYDFHATMVGHVLAGTGYVAATGSTAAGYSYVGTGLAPLAKLWSGSIATSYSTTDIGAFSTTPASTIPVYRQFFQGISGTACDVINSSFGGFDPSATSGESMAVDALAFQNPTVSFVASAGNEGAAAVGSPGSTYNAITVGSVGGPTFLTPSPFSSHGAVDFYNPATGVMIPGVRAAVDLAAPGENDFLAAYLGPTGGLGPFPDYTQNPSPTDLYFTNVDGSSFSSPTVAGGIALMKDAAKGIGFVPVTALDTRVIKAVLMATARETEGWSNGQTLVDGVVQTVQPLDWATGAGALDLTAAGLTYINGATLDLSGTGGTIGDNGWDLGTITVGGTTDYLFSAPFGSSMELQVALNWFADGSFDSLTDTGSRTAFADLDLQVWRTVSGSFTSMVAESVSAYDNNEFLRLSLTEPGSYGLRITLPGMVYDIGTTPVTSETFGLSWTTIPVPEPSMIAATVGLIMSVMIAKRSSRYAQSSSADG